MRRCVVAALVLIGAVAVTPDGGPAGAVGTAVPDTLIGFSQDSAGSRPNGFTSADSALVHFSDTLGTPDLVVGDFDAQSNGNALAVFNFVDGSAVRILLDRPTTRISLRFGNDDPTQQQPGDAVVLTAYRGTTLVGRRQVVMNLNDAMDQTIGFSNGPLFNRVVVAYPRMAGEVIDDIRIGPLCTIAGTEASETLVGTAGNDVICGGGGNDTIYGRGGRDHLTGGPGVDTLHGEDFLAGNQGNDTVRGGPANDRVEGGEQDDRAYGDGGDDVVSGGPGTDTCNGGTGTDTALSCETATGF
jgi:hypothetical protein